MVIIRVFRSDMAGTAEVGMAAAGVAVVVGMVAAAVGTVGVAAGMVAAAVAAGMAAAVVTVKHCFRVGLVNKTEFA